MTLHIGHPAQLRPALLLGLPPELKTSQDRSSSPPPAGDYEAGHLLRPPPATTLPARNTAAITPGLTLDSVSLGETADLKMNHD